MTREELKGIIEGITDEQLKSILDINSADIGKAKKDAESIKSENETLKADKQNLETRIEELTKSSGDAAKFKKELDDLKADIQREKDEAKAKAEDAALTDAIVAVIGDKKFTSDYVRNGIIADMKTEIAKPENKGKGYVEIYEGLTKDKEGIFANPNPPANMTGMGKLTSTGMSDLENMDMAAYIAARKQMEG